MTHRTGLIWWILVIRGDVAAQCLARDALELVTVADSAPPGLCALGSSAVRHGYRLTILGANRSAYHDLLESKPRMLLDFLRRDASLNNVVAFVDGFDVLAQRGPGAALAGWAHVGSPDILFGSESYCFPFRRGRTPSVYCRRTVQSLRVGDKLVCLGKARRLYAELGVDIVRHCAKLAGTTPEESLSPQTVTHHLSFLSSGLCGRPTQCLRHGAFSDLLKSPLVSAVSQAGTGGEAPRGRLETRTKPSVAGLTDQAVFHEQRSPTPRW